jgi:hypothetical protein
MPRLFRRTARSTATISCELDFIPSKISDEPFPTLGGERGLPGSGAVAATASSEMHRRVLRLANTPWRMLRRLGVFPAWNTIWSRIVVQGEAHHPIC